MDMSAAALPPRMPHISEQDRQHPRFGEYRTYRAGCSRLMIDAASFQDWLRSTENGEYRDNWAKHPQYPAFLAWMRATKGGARKCPAGNSFPDNFKYWMTGERW